MIMLAVEEIQVQNVKLLAVDGHHVCSEMVCDRCAHGPEKPTEDLVETEGTTGAETLRIHCRIFNERGWRVVDGAVLCPSCVEQACEESAAY
ncbi:MAG: hypothetical protein ACPGXK_14005 [Phycisphaerae bacterium]